MAEAAGKSKHHHHAMTTKKSPLAAKEKTLEVATSTRKPPPRAEDDSIDDGSDDTDSLDFAMKPYYVDGPRIGGVVANRVRVVPLPQLPHNVVVWRSSASSDLESSRATSLLESRANAMLQAGSGVTDYEPGTYHQLTKLSINGMHSTNDEHRTKLQYLNERFANCVDRMQKLEMENAVLVDTLRLLKEHWGDETTRLKAAYEKDLQEPRDEIEAVENEMGKLKIKASSMEERQQDLIAEYSLRQEQVASLKELLEENKKRIKQYVNQIAMLKKHYAIALTEQAKDADNIISLKSLVEDTREKLDEVTSKYINAENKRQTLEERIQFYKVVYAQEVKELMALMTEGEYEQDNDFWELQIQLAIKEIEQMYTDRTELAKAEWSEAIERKLERDRNMWQQSQSYNADVSTLLEELGRLKDEVAAIQAKIRDLEAKRLELTNTIQSLRREKEDRERQLVAENAEYRYEMNQSRLQMDLILHRLEEVSDSKIGLELEIEAYRRLLDGMEGRTTEWELVLKALKDGEDPRDAIIRYIEENRHKRGDPKPIEYTDKPKPLKPENDDKAIPFEDSGVTQARTTFTRNALGSIAVVDCPPDGRLICLKNRGKRTKNIQGWKIYRIVDGTGIPPYTLDYRFNAFEPGTQITIWGEGKMTRNAGENDFEMSEPNWGIGMNVVTTLVNSKGVERASLIQRTVYS